MIKNESGQAILALILIMTVALAIGLSVVQKSLVDVSTSTKVEESSRAFSAAEGGIEKALQLKTNTSVDFDNSSNAKVTDSGLIPAIPTSGIQDPLEYPPLAKEEVAHVWLANFDSTGNPPTEVYKQNSLDVYWGDPTVSDKAALELTVVYYDNTLSQYKSQKWYLDQILRDPDNKFDRTASCPPAGIKPPSGVVAYQCKKNLPSLPSGLMLVRARLLYNSTSQPFAVQAVGTGAGHYIPPQARIFISTGVSGETQRKVRVFQIPKVVPPYFDYAIFSLGEIRK